MTRRELLDSLEKGVANIFADDTEKEPVQKIPVARSGFTHKQQLTDF